MNGLLASTIVMPQRKGVEAAVLLLSSVGLAMIRIKRIPPANLATMCIM